MNIQQPFVDDNDFTSTDDSMWRLKITPHGIINGLLRLKMEGLIFGPYSSNTHLIKFKLEYKTINNIQQKSDEWQSYIFMDKYDEIIRNVPKPHLNIRIDSNLYDYNILFRLTTMFCNEFIFDIQDDIDHVIEANKWFSCSNIVNINIPSLMKEPSFELNDWIQFKKHDNSSNLIVGKILNKNCKNDIYKIVSHDDDDDGTIYTVKYIESNENIQYLPAHGVIDLTNQIEVEKDLLIGYRINGNKQLISELYQIMTEFVYNEYITKCVVKYWCDVDNEVDFISMAKCIVVNVIDFLWIKQNEYKINCIFSKNDHFDDILQISHQRQHVINKCIESKDLDIQNWSFYCDICLCTQGDYYWMYRCQIEKAKQYEGHDLCLNCVHNMIKTYNQLKELLNQLLSNDLTLDCIQTIVSYTAGSVVCLTF